MSESTTMFCKIRVEDLSVFLKRLTMLNASTIDSSVTLQWNSVTCKIDGNASVQFNRMFFTERADPFTKKRARAIVEFERRTRANPQGVATVVEHLESTESILAVVATPSFDSIPKLPELVAFLAAEYDALIFNGRDMLDFLGNVIA